MTRSNTRSPFPLSSLLQRPKTHTRKQANNCTSTNQARHEKQLYMQPPFPAFLVQTTKKPQHVPPLETLSAPNQTCPPSPTTSPHSFRRYDSHPCTPSPVLEGPRKRKNGKTQRVYYLLPVTKCTLKRSASTLLQEKPCSSPLPARRDKQTPYHLFRISSQYA